MVSVVIAALLVLHKPDKSFGATHGKGLNCGAKLFIFDEPTVGVDVGAKAEIYRLLASLLAKGAGIIMVSSSLPKVYNLAGALHAFRAGGLVASPGLKDATQETILTEAIGV
jgi:ribose transport system ATP-binding protein